MLAPIGDQHRNLAAKNSLTAEDAKVVEERFRARLASITDFEASIGASVAPAAVGTSSGLATDPPPAVADQSMTAPSRAAPSKKVPHHLTFTQPRALGSRVSDEFIVPVCRIHHRELHRSGNEAEWWQKFNIDPLPVALRLWKQTRTDGEVVAPKEEVTQAQVATTADVSAQGRAEASDA